MFRSDAGCRDYIHRLRWPDGFACPHCRWTGEPWVTSRGLLHCRGARGRVLDGGHRVRGDGKPLRMWFLAMWLSPVLGLQRVLGLGSWTAWTFHKLRRAMVRPGRDCLTGAVDETYVGGPEEGNGKPKGIVAVATEKRGFGIGRIRHRRVKDVSSDCLLRFVQNAVSPGSVVHTDGWSGRLGGRFTVISDGSEPAHEVSRESTPLLRFSSAARHPPGRHSAPGLLPRRIHLPFKRRSRAPSHRSPNRLSLCRFPTAFIGAAGRQTPELE